MDSIFNQKLEDALMARSDEISDLYSKFRQAVEQKDREQQLEILKDAETKGIDLWDGVKSQFLDSILTRKNLAKQWEEISNVGNLAPIRDQLTQLELDEIQRLLKQAIDIQQVMNSSVDISFLRTTNTELERLISEIPNIDISLRNVRERQAVHNRYVMLMQIQMAESAVIKSLQRIDDSSAPTSPETVQQSREQLTSAIGKMSELLKKAESLNSFNTSPNPTESLMNLTFDIDEYRAQITQFRENLATYQECSDSLLTVNEELLHDGEDRGVRFKKSNSPLLDKRREEAKDEKQFRDILEMFSQSLNSWIDVAKEKSNTKNAVSVLLDQLDKDMIGITSGLDRLSLTEKSLAEEKVIMWRHRINTARAALKKLDDDSQHIQKAKTDIEGLLDGKPDKKVRQTVIENALRTIETFFDEFRIQNETLPPEICLLLRSQTMNNIHAADSLLGAIRNQGGVTPEKYDEELKNIIQRQSKRVDERIDIWLSTLPKRT